MTPYVDNKNFTSWLVFIVICTIIWSYGVFGLKPVAGPALIRMLFFASLGWWSIELLTRYWMRRQDTKQLGPWQ